MRLAGCDGPVRKAESLPPLEPDGSELKKVPFCSCASSANPAKLVDKLPGSAVKVKPLALLPDQVTLTWFSTYSPANRSMLVESWKLSRRVTGPLHMTSKDTVAGTKPVCQLAPKALALVRKSPRARLFTCISAIPPPRLTLTALSGMAVVQKTLSTTPLLPMEST